MLSAHVFGESTAKLPNHQSAAVDPLQKSDVDQYLQQLSKYSTGSSVSSSRYIPIWPAFCCGYEANQTINHTNAHEGLEQLPIFASCFELFCNWCSISNLFKEITYFITHKHSVSCPTHGNSLVEVRRRLKFMLNQWMWNNLVPHVSFFPLQLYIHSIISKGKKTLALLQTFLKGLF